MDEVMKKSIAAMAAGLMAGSKAMAEGKSPTQVKRIQLAAETKAYEIKEDK